jgi:hypothetical protein
MSPKTSPLNFPIDPRLAAQSVGTLNHPPAWLLGGGMEERVNARVRDLTPMSATVRRSLARRNG